MVQDVHESYVLHVVSSDGLLPLKNIMYTFEVLHVLLLPSAKSHASQEYLCH